MTGSGQTFTPGSTSAGDVVPLSCERHFLACVDCVYRWASAGRHANDKSISNTGAAATTVPLRTAEFGAGRRLCERRTECRPRSN